MKQSLLAVALLSGLTAAAAVPAAVYLQVPGVQGESAADGRAQWIDVLAFNLQFSKGICQGLTVAKYLDAASPPLSAAAVTGQAFSEMTLAVEKDGEERFEYLTVTLHNAVVTSVGVSSLGNERPTESIGLQAETVTMVYRPQTDTGAVGTPIESVLSCKKLKQ